MHFGLSNVIFLVVLAAGAGLFAWQFNRIMKNINLGLPLNRKDRTKDRLNTMIMVALGQQKMFKRPLAAALHATVYVGFLIINIEVLEIIIDGIFNTHRVLGFMGPIYDALMAVNEILGVIVILSCAIFLWRRNVMKVKRFTGVEMGRWPKLDANIILWTEIVLMIGLFAFNTGEMKLTGGNPAHGVFPVSAFLANVLPDLTPMAWANIALVGWWFHIVGILAFLNYLPISKHFHIIMAFPNTFASNLEPAGKFTNNEFIKHEIKSSLDPSYEMPAEFQTEELPTFGSRDVTDLTWKQLMDAYTCTECGRCTDNCPANLTGKKLSPRKIIMDTRDRLEELKKAGADTAEKAQKYAEEKGTALLGDYISNEELWACTTCNACVEACPVNIDHVSSIMDLRRYLVMTESSAPSELNSMLTNIDNNGAPWPMPASSRFDWANDIEMPETAFPASAN